MATLMQASKQWSSRPNDERFVSLTAMQEHFHTLRATSKSAVVSSRRLEAAPLDSDPKGSLVLHGPNGNPATMTHWSFGQVSTLAGAPASYLRTLPAALAADNINYGLKYKRDIEDVGVLLTRGDEFNVLRAATGPRYGRIWNAAIVDDLIDRFGDGQTGPWRVPGEFGKEVAVTKANTTLYGSDRDMFVFLANERNRIEIPNRRNGQPGSLARGFFAWNSEVGSSVFGLGTFLFDYVCMNRIVWGATEYKEIRIRHNAGAPDRFLEEVTPALQNYAEGSASNIVKAIEQARSARLDNVDEFLAKRFSKSLMADLKETHKVEEGRPIENLWDVTTAATALARSIQHQDARVALERQAGEIMALAA